MRILELIEFIRSRVSYVYFPNRFPREDDPSHRIDACAAVSIYPGEGADAWTGKRIPHFQVLVRGNPDGHAEVEAKANEIFDALVNARFAQIGSDQIVQITAIGSAPFYIGDDHNDRPVYSMNFRAVIQPRIQREE